MLKKHELHSAPLTTSYSKDLSWLLLCHAHLRDDWDNTSMQQAGGSSEAHPCHYAASQIESIEAFAAQLLGFHRAAIANCAASHSTPLRKAT
jgi:hypothetical protein